MSRIRIRTITKEVDKPQGGGGKGTEALYAAEVLLDGQLALTLQTHSFKKPGQFADFCEILEARSRATDSVAAQRGIDDPLPHGLTRQKAIEQLRAYRQAGIAWEREKAADRLARGDGGGKERDLKPGQKPGVWPIDALLDYIEECGFPAP